MVPNLSFHTFLSLQLWQAAEQDMAQLPEHICTANASASSGIPWQNGT